MSTHAEKQKKHIVLWGGWYGSHNLGDQVLLLTVTDILAQALDGNVRFTALTDNPEQLLSYTRQESPWKIEPLHNKRQFPQIVRAIAGCDLFVFGGGVPFFEQTYHLAVMSGLVGIARMSRTPYMTWSVSSQPVHRQSARLVFRWVLNGAAAVTFRDEHTRKLFADSGVKKAIHLSADSGFYLEPDSDEYAWQMIYRAGYQAGDRRLVALVPRTLGGHGDAVTHYQAKTPTQFQKEIDTFALAVDWLWDHGYQPIFVPHNLHAPDDDRIVSRMIVQAAQHGSQALQINEIVSPRLAPAIYKQCDFAMVARVHGAVMCMVGNCPPIMYAFDLKHTGIMETMRLAENCLHEAQTTPDSTQAMLEHISSTAGLLRQVMAARLAELRQEAQIPARLALEILKPA